MQILLKRDGTKTAKLTKSELDSLAKAQQIIDTLCATDLMPEDAEDASTTLSQVIAKFSPEAAPPAKQPDKSRPAA